MLIDITEVCVSVCVCVENGTEQQRIVLAYIYNIYMILMLVVIRN